MKGPVETQLRRLILALFSMGVVGVGAELVAIGHFEDSWQLVPLVVLSVAVVSAGWQAAAGQRTSVQLLRLVALGMLVTGALGIWRHFLGNMEFQLETNPDLAGWQLIARVLHATAPPALAPGVMAQLGLLGLIYCFRHPLSRKEHQT